MHFCLYAVVKTGHLYLDDVLCCVGAGRLLVAVKSVRVHRLVITVFITHSTRHLVYYHKYALLAEII